MERFSLISALIGGFVTAVFTYLIQVLLFRRSQKKGQRQLALLYLTRISPIVALKKAIETLPAYKESIEKLREVKIMGSEELDPVKLHIICVALIEELQNKSKLLDILFTTQMRKALNIVKALIDQDNYFGYKIDDEILSSLPIDSIVQYHFFIDRILFIRRAMSDWVSAFESKDFSLLDADDLFQLLTSFKRVVDNAENLRSSLIIKAKIKNKEAAAILREQLKYYTKEMVALEKDKKTIGIFKEFIEKAKQDTKSQVTEK